MKKIVRLTEQDLHRIVKRVIMEQVKKPTEQKWHTFANLRDVLSKYGFKEDSAFGKATGTLLLSKGDDTNGMFIKCTTSTGFWEWGVVQKGKLVKSGKHQMNLDDYNNIGKEGTMVYNKIMSDLKPFFK